MALIKCPKCGEEIPEDALLCPKCGASIDKMSIQNEESNINNVDTSEESPNVIKEDNNVLEQSLVPTQVEGRTKEAPGPKKNLKKKVIIGGVVAVAVVAGIAYYATADMRAFNKANNLMLEKEYDQAIEIYTEIKDYKNSEDLITSCYLGKVSVLCESGDYQEALKILKDYNITDQDLTNKCNYGLGKQEKEKGNYEKAVEYLGSCKGYEDTNTLLNECNYQLGESLYEKKDYAGAAGRYEKCLSYEDSQDKYDECMYIVGKSYLKDSDYAQAAECFSKSNYKNSKDLNKKCSTLASSKIYDGRFYMSSDEYLSEAYMCLRDMNSGFTFKEADVDDGKMYFAFYNGANTGVAIMVYGISTDDDEIESFEQIVVGTVSYGQNDNEALGMIGMAIATIQAVGKELDNDFSSKYKAKECYEDLINRALKNGGTASTTYGGVDLTLKGEGSTDILLIIEPSV